MRWIHEFQLYLFDFDGLLVNTEHIHFQAYINMLSLRGYKLDWTFNEYCSIAHYDDKGIKENVYAKFPLLYEQEPNWENLRRQKNEIYLSLLNLGKVEMMPGAEKLLKLLADKKINRCVVTNATRPQIEIIKRTNGILETIPHWVTREEYLNPKPSPDCYIRAIELYGKKGDRIIGFEDTLRGLRALLQTPATGVLISASESYLALQGSLPRNVYYFKSLEELPSDLLS
ncbi:MAG: HAD family phosphatase [Chlamydiae bacterium]|nr:HAD family phosphatase [Chlamydiota bacterium]